MLKKLLEKCYFVDQNYLCGLFVRKYLLKHFLSKIRKTAMKVESVRGLKFIGSEGKCESCCIICGINLTKLGLRGRSGRMLSLVTEKFWV